MDLPENSRDLNLNEIFWFIMCVKTAKKKQAIKITLNITF